MIRVLYIIDSMYRAGAQNNIAYLVRMHDRAMFKPSVLCLQEKGALGEELEREGHQVLALGLKRVYSSRAISGYPRFISFLKKERIDVVHAYLFAAQLYGIPAARIAGVPLIIAGHRSVGVYWSQARYAFFRRCANALCHLHIANSEAVKDYVISHEGVAPDRVRVVYNGVDCARFAPPTDRDAAFRPGSVTVGYVGSLTRVKRIDMLLNAIHNLKSSERQLNARLIGPVPTDVRRRKEGDTDISLKRLAAELGLNGRVAFVGPSMCIENELKKIDIFVMPSESEGMSNAILEAMASGLPVVAGDAGGNRETVVHGVTGCLFRSGDIESLTRHLSELALDPGRRSAMGMAGRARALERFTLEGMVSGMEKTYTEELEARRRR